MIKQILTALLLTLSTQLLPAAAASGNPFDVLFVSDSHRCPKAQLEEALKEKSHHGAITSGHIRRMLFLAGDEFIEHWTNDWQKLVPPMLNAYKGELFHSGQIADMVHHTYVGPRYGPYKEPIIKNWCRWFEAAEKRRTLIKDNHAALLAWIGTQGNFPKVLLPIIDEYYGESEQDDPFLSIQIFNKPNATEQEKPKEEPKSCCTIS